MTTRAEARQAGNAIHAGILMAVEGTPEHRLGELVQRFADMTELLTLPPETEPAVSGTTTEQSR